MNKNELDAEIREVQKAVKEIEGSEEPTTKGALKHAKSDLSYLLTLLDN